MNLFEKQNKPFAIKLSDRVKKEIKKEFGSDCSNITYDFFVYNYGLKMTFLNKIPKDLNLITEAEFFGDGNNKLREKLKELNCKDCDIPFCEEKCIMFSEFEINQLEKITDDFADKFIEWKDKLQLNNEIGLMDRGFSIYMEKGKNPIQVTTAELRQIFKTQHYE